MQKILRQVAAAAAIAVSIATPQARAAVVVDFNDPSLETAYAPGDSFSQNGFLMTQLDDAGLVGSNYDLGSVAPVGNSTLYYSNFNNGSLLVSRVDGGAFTLQSFDLAFVPLLPAPSPPQTLYLGVLSLSASGAVDFPFVFPYAASTASGYPFQTYSSASIAAAYKNVSALEFFTCSVNSVDDCIDARNNGQFALDNLTFIVPVPEPTTSALMVLGLVGFAGQRLRSRGNNDRKNERSQRIRG